MTYLATAGRDVTRYLADNILSPAKPADVANGIFCRRTLNTPKAWGDAGPALYCGSHIRIKRCNAFFVQHQLFVKLKGFLFHFIKGFSEGQKYAPELHKYCTGRKIRVLCECHTCCLHGHVFPPPGGISVQLQDKYGPQICGKPSQRVFLKL